MPRLCERRLLAQGAVMPISRFLPPDCARSFSPRHSLFEHFGAVEPLCRRRARADAADLSDFASSRLEAGHA